MKYLLLFFLLACSVGRLFVGSLDTYVTAKTADRLKLYTKQETALGLDIEKLFNEIKPEIKLINQNLNKIKKSQPLDLEDEIVKATLEAASSAYIKGVKIVAKYNAQMTQKQLNLFLKDYEKKVEKKRKKLKLKRYKKILPERFEEIFGELNKNQIALLKTNAETFLGFSKRRFNEQEIHLNALKEANAESDREKQIKKILDSYTVVENSVKEDLTIHLPTVVKVINQFFKTLTKDQRDELEEKTELAQGIMEAFIKHKY